VANLINDDAFDQLEQEMVQNQDLSRAVESLKDDIEGEIDQDKTVGQYNLERELDSRERTIDSALSSALAKANNVKGNSQDLNDRTEEDDFQRNMRRDAVDSDDMQKALDINDELEQLVARLTLVLKIYRDDRQLLRSGIDMQQLRANESKVMDMVEGMVETQETQFQNMSNKIADEFAGRVESMIEDKMEASEQQKELMQQMQETAQELKEARETPQKQVIETRPQQAGAGNERSASSHKSDTSVGKEEKSSSTESEDGNADVESDEEHPDLTPSQEDLYNLVQENPGKDLEWYANQLNQKENIIKMWRTKIQKVDGYEDFSLE